MALTVLNNISKEDLVLVPDVQVELIQKVDDRFCSNFVYMMCALQRVV